MAYKALYRTYRPQTFEEVAGQKAIVRTLKNALSTGRIAHAYLFAGPRGTGKTTLAKLFAKALNCEKGVGQQCNECSNCVEISEGSHPDVIEIDAASNNGVEQVRDLVDKVGYLPIKGRYKVYIIDEVHMMTANAFNALLKTLEEPPAHVVFILATTEPYNILPTIISRCQRYDFTKVSDEDIAGKLIEILNKEKASYEPAGLKALIRLADGSVRDALSMLDQLLAYGGGCLKEADVFALFGLATHEEKIDFIRKIAQGDVTSCLTMITSFAQGGADLKRLIADVIEMLKDVLVHERTLASGGLSVLTREEADELSGLISHERLDSYLQILLKGQGEFKMVSDVKTLIEIMTISMCAMSEGGKTASETAKTPSIAAQKEKATEKATTFASFKQPEKTTAFASFKQPQERKPMSADLKAKTTSVAQLTGEKNGKVPDWLFADDDEPVSKKAEVILEGERNHLDDDTIIKIMVLGNKNERKALLARWSDLDSQLNHPLYGDVIALVRDGKPFIVAKNAVVLEYDFEKLADRANVRVNQGKVANVLGKMLGRDVFVYAISRDESVRLVNAYHNLRQLSRLPRENTIKLDFSKMKK